MTASVVGPLFAAVLGTATSASQTSVPTTAALAIGDTAVVAWSQPAGAAVSTMVVTDDSGNVYNPTAVAFVSSTTELVMAKANITVPMAIGGHVIFTSTVGGGADAHPRVNIFGLKVQGVGDFDITPVIAGGGSGATPTLSIGPTTTDGDLLVTAWTFGSAAGALTFPGAYTVTQEVTVTGTSDKRLAIAYQVLGAHPITTNISPTIAGSATGWAAAAFVLSPSLPPRQAFTPSADIATSGSSHTGAGTFSQVLADTDGTSTVTTPSGGVEIYKLSSNVVSATKTGWQIEITGKFDNSSASDFVEIFQGTSWTDASSRAALFSGTATYSASSATQVIAVSSTDATKVTDGTALYIRVTTAAS